MNTKLTTSLLILFISLLSTTMQSQNEKYQAESFIRSTDNSFTYYGIRPIVSYQGDSQPLTDAHKEFIHTDVTDRILPDILEFIRDDGKMENIYSSIDEYFNNKTMSDTANDKNPYKGKPILAQITADLRMVEKYLFPGEPNLVDLLEYVEDRTKKLGVKMEEELDDVAINDVHRANLNKLVFTSNSNINPETAPASEYKTEFIPGEEIFAVLMCDKPISQSLVNQTNADYRIKKTTDPYGSYDMRVEHEMFPVKANQQFLIFPVVVKASKFVCGKWTSGQTDRGMMYLADLGPRKHKLIVEINDRDQFSSALGRKEGALTINGMKGDMEAYRQMAIEIKDKCNRE